VTLQAVKLSGQTVFAETDLLSVLGEVKDKSYDFQGLEQLATQLANHYHLNGYPFASASLPAQDLKDGVLRIEIIEGRYGVISSSGEFLPEDAAPFLANLKTEDVIEAKLLERTMLIIDDLPMISVSPSVRPGQNYGTGDLDVRITRNSVWDGELGLDNLGNRFTGENRVKGTLNGYSKFMFGDMVRLSAINTDQNMWLGSLDYEAPLNGQGLRGQIGFAKTTYQLGKDYTYLGASGFANVYTSKISYPVVRTQQHNLTLAVGYTEKQLQDRYVNSGTQNNKKSHAFPFSAYFDARDAFMGGGLTYGNIAYTHGHLSLDDSLSASDATSAQTQGGFNKLNFEVARMQTLPADFSFFARYSAQLASKNLDSSERFNLGGIYGVRAYPIGEGMGDRGWVTQMELRYKFDQVMGFLLLDNGTSTSNVRPWGGQLSANTHLAGKGFGARVQQEKGWNWEASLSWRNTGLPASDTINRNPRLWAYATYKF
jgi:hemolysin activation/secretion protein